MLNNLFYVARRFVKISVFFNLLTMYINLQIPKVEMERLFIHRIPVCATSEDLSRVIPGDHTIEILVLHSNRP